MLGRYKMLTPKQQRFCQEYLVDFNATQAAIRAGYSKKTANEQGSRLLANINIKSEISKGMAELSEKTKGNAQWVLENLIEVSERCMQKTPVVKFDRTKKVMKPVIDEKTGEGTWEFDSAGANRALELIGKHRAMFVERSQADLKVTVEVIESFNENHDPI